MTPELRDILTPKQINVLEYNQEYNPRHIILEGAIRTGKTILNIFLFLLHVDTFKNQKKKFIITGSSVSSVKRNVLDEIERIFDIPTNLNVRNEFQLFGNTVICFGADKADSYKAIKGSTAYGWLANEVTEHHKNTRDQCFKRCSGAGSKILWDTNPANPEHEVNTQFVQKSGMKLDDGREFIKSFHFVLDDNIFLSKEYIQAVKESTPTGMWYDRDILGMWVAAEGVCYLDFNREEHVVEELPEGETIKEYFAGQDWGWTHPGVLAYYGIGSTGTCYKLGEIVERQKGIKWWSEQVLKLYVEFGRFPVYCPHDRPENRDEYLKAGIDARKANNAVFEGITYIAQEFNEKDAIKIIRDTNQNYLKEIQGYRWKPGSKEEPIKEMDDSCDADRYARYTHLGKSNEMKTNTNNYKDPLGWS